MVQGRYREISHQDLGDCTLRRAINEVDPFNESGMMKPHLADPQRMAEFSAGHLFSFHREKTEAKERVIP